MGDFEVTAAMLEAAFGWAAAGLTGVSAGALGAVGGVAMVGGYSIWAAENPEEAAQFEQYLAHNVVSQDVSGNQQLAMNLQAMPSSLKDSIIDYVASGVVNVGKTPVLPSGVTLPEDLELGMHSSAFGRPIVFFGDSKAFIDQQSHYFLKFKTDYINNYTTKCWVPDEIYIFDPSWTCTIYGNNKNFSCGTNGSKTYYYTKFNSNGTYNELTTYSNISDVGFGLNENHPSFIVGVDIGAGFETVPVYSGVSSGLSGAFNSLVAGTGTASDVAVAGGVQAVYLPNVAINDGTVTVDDAYDVSVVTYPDITITIDGGGGSGTVPLPDDALTALQQIIGLLTPMGIITGIPPIVQDIDTKMSAIVDTWPGVMDILDGLGLLPPIVQDIADGMGVIIDIPQSLEDITDILLPIPQSLQGLLDGVTIDIPQTLAQILNGTLSIPTAIDGVISGVAALPTSIADVLDIDWVLENTEELKDRLPDLEAPIILPQASFEDLKDVANDYKERTPLGKIFEAYEGTFEVMSTSPQGAPRYEITFPSPINYTFVIDFAVFDGLFVQLAHAFFYLLAIFWYLKFLKSVKGWVDSWLTFDGKFFHVAGEEAGASWE